MRLHGQIVFCNQVQDPIWGGSVGGSETPYCPQFIFYRRNGNLLVQTSSLRCIPRHGLGIKGTA
jgi:hypothetical protein